MKLFDRFRRVRRTIDDPLFGILEYHESGCWRGDAPFESGGEDIGIEIKTGGPEPTDAHRRLFLDLRQRYASLASDFGRELLRLYAPHAERGSEMGLARPELPDQMMAVVELGWIEILSDRELRLGFGFRPDVDWSDALFTIRMQDWRPTGESLEG